MIYFITYLLKLTFKKFLNEFFVGLAWLFNYQKSYTSPNLNGEYAAFRGKKKRSNWLLER